MFVFRFEPDRRWIATIYMTFVVLNLYAFFEYLSGYFSREPDFSTVLIEFQWGIGQILSVGFLILSLPVGFFISLSYETETQARLGAMLFVFLPFVFFVFIELMN